MLRAFRALIDPFLYGAVDVYYCFFFNLDFFVILKCYGFFFRDVALPYANLMFDKRVHRGTNFGPCVSSGHLVSVKIYISTLCLLYIILLLCLFEFV